VAEVRRTEVLVPGPAVALAGLLGVPAPVEELPLLWHWVYLLDRAPQDDLGPDGHPFRGVVPEPAGTGMRRMYAGGRVRLEAPLRLGAEATRRSWSQEPVIKQGRSGRLVFVTVRTEVAQDDRVRVVEEQDLVYLEAAPGPSTPPASGAGGPAPEGWSLPLSPTFLFRFSALTYNAHRVHYDQAYARDVEGYDGLVVHGPLQAIAMAEAARSEAGRSAGSIEFRLTAPLLLGQGMTVASTSSDDGWLASVRDRESAAARLGTG
jgi:3-methylfumaryl-CoA hydratase